MIEFSCPSELNISSKIQEKMNNYAPLLENMRIIYPHYRFEMLPVIVGALGLVPSYLFNCMNDLGIERTEALRHIDKMKAIVSSGTIKICKTFLNFYTIRTPPIEN